MADTIVIDNGEPEKEPEEIEAPAVEVIEASADAQVAIAAIEAEARVEIEEIQAEVALANAEARKVEAEAYKEVKSEWQQNIEASLSNLFQEVAAMSLTLSSLMQKPDPPQSEMNPPLESDAVDPPALDEKQEAPEPVKPRKKARWI